MSLAIFVASLCVIVSMYGGGFATIPAYLADMFGTQFVGAIHGRLLTAWSTAGILGPVVVNYMHDVRVEAQVPFDQIYGPIFYVLAAMLAIGFVANLLVRPVDEKFFMSDAELAAEKKLAHEQAVTVAKDKTTEAKRPEGSGHGSGVYDSLKEHGFDPSLANSYWNRNIVMEYNTDRDGTKIQIPDGHHRVAAAAALERARGANRRTIWFPMQYEAYGWSKPPSYL